MYDQESNREVTSIQILNHELNSEKRTNKKMKKEITKRKKNIKARDQLIAT